MQNLQNMFAASAAQASNPPAAATGTSTSASSEQAPPNPFQNLFAATGAQASSAPSTASTGSGQQAPPNPMANLQNLLAAFGNLPSQAPAQRNVVEAVVSSFHSLVSTQLPSSQRWHIKISCGS
jgi:hypothetical protein